MPWVEARAPTTSSSCRRGQSFVAWGFNYDHDEKGRLLEDYWEKEWPKVERDFAEMKKLGANVVRIHLQFNQWMTHAEKPNGEHQSRPARSPPWHWLRKLYGLYLDITGLACYRKRGTFLLGMIV